MYWWLLVSLVVFIGTVAYVGYWVISHIRERERETEAFLQSLGTPIPDSQPRTNYEGARKKIFDIARKENASWEEERLEEDKTGDPSNAWHRKVKENNRIALRTALIKRCVTYFPHLVHIPQELQQKFQLYQRGLLGDCQWKQLLTLRDWLQDESLQIRHEAECIEENWGTDGQIFHDAGQIHEKMMKQKMESSARRRA